MSREFRKQVGVLDLTKIVNKRTLDVEVEMLEGVMADQLTSPITFDGEFPPPIQQIINQVKAVYDFGSEMDRYRVMIWHPRIEFDPKKPSTHTIPRATFDIAARVIVPIGGSENFIMAGRNGNQKGSGNILCRSGDSFSVPMGVSAVLECSFDDTTHVDLPPRSGFRNRSAHKDPSRVYVCVIDGIASVPILIKKIKEMAANMAGGQEAAEKLEQKFRKSMGIPDDAQ